MSLVPSPLESLACPVTGVGSLPFTLAEEAIQFVAECTPEIPHWPQLPRRHAAEGMIQQFLGDARAELDVRARQAGYFVKSRTGFLAGLAEATGALDAERAAGFFAFDKALIAGRFPRARVLKGQVTGAWTLATTLHVGDGLATSDADVLAALVQLVQRNVRWQIDALRRFELPVLMQIDEPGLGTAATAEQIRVAQAGLAETIACVRAAGAIPLVHACARPRAELFAQVDAPLALDAHEFADECVALARSRTSPCFALGLAPPKTPLAFDPAAHAALWRARAGADAEPIAAQSLITPSCGLALATPHEAARSMKLCAALAAEFAAGRRLAHWH